MKRWGGWTAAKARRALEPIVRSGCAICARCGRPVRPDEAWDVGHVVDQALGGTHHPSNLQVEHARCNRRAGQQLGQEARRIAKRNGMRLRKW